MATLEKIRSKSVLLIIVIGVALLAFIIGDAITNSRNLFGNSTTVAKVDGKKIEYPEFSKVHDMYQGRLADDQEMTEKAMQELISNALLDKAVDQLGIKVTGEMLGKFMFSMSSPNAQVIYVQLQNLKKNPQTPEQMYDMIFNPKKYGIPEDQAKEMQRLWVSDEQEMQKAIARSMYMSLVNGAVKANSLDKQALYNEQFVGYPTRLAMKPYDEEGAKQYKVSDAELKAKYEEQKNLYRITEPSKTMQVIAVNVSPSDADQKASAALAQKAKDALTTNSSDALQGLKKSGVQVQHVTLPEKQINDPALKNFLTAGNDSTANANETVDVAILKQDIEGFMVARKNKKTVEVDGVKTNLIGVIPEIKDEILAKLNSGADVDSIINQYGKEKAGLQKDFAFDFYGQNAAPADIAKKLMEGGDNYFVLEEGPQGVTIVKVLEKNEPANIYDYDIAAYQLTPSSETLESVRAKLEKFTQNNNDPAKFAQNAAKSGYTVVPIKVSGSTAAIPRAIATAMPGGSKYLPESRQLVAWAVKDGSKGEVSDVFVSASNPNDQWIYAGAIVDEYKDFIPYNDPSIKAELERQIRNAKYGDALVKQYTAAGNTVDEVAAAMGVNVQDQDVRLGNARMFEPGVVGTIVTTPAGQNVKVVKGKNGVYAYQVGEKQTTETQRDDKAISEQYKQMNTIFQPRDPNSVIKALGSGKKIEYNILNFYGNKK